MDRAKLLAFLEERLSAARLRGDGTGTLMFAIYQGLISRVKRGDFDGDPFPGEVPSSGPIRHRRSKR